MPLQPNVPFSFEDLPKDLAILKQALQATLGKAAAPTPTPTPTAAPGSALDLGLALKGKRERRLLNLACGRADETGVLAEVFGEQSASLEIVGADIRAPEIAEANLRWKAGTDSDVQTRFHVEDGRRFLDSLASNDRFDLAFLRHQNFWNDPALWERMFDGALRQLEDDGLFVITSYFDKEHRLACEKLSKLGAVKVAEYRNPLARDLPDAPGKSIDRHIAIFRRQDPS